MMNNKKIGNEFEEEFCNLLKQEGYWVHFISPDRTGAQPFDVIAVKNGVPYAIDCKTSCKKWFSIERLEENQKMAFDRWMAAGNGCPYIAVKYNESIYEIPYLDFVISHDGKINLEAEGEIYRWK